MATDTLLAAAELLANATQHTPGPERLDLDLDGRVLRITVTDRALIRRARARTGPRFRTGTDCSSSSGSLRLGDTGPQAAASWCGSSWRSGLPARSDQATSTEPSLSGAPSASRRAVVVSRLEGSPGPADRDAARAWAPDLHRCARRRRWPSPYGG
ncbi:hypothetical protein KPATCC21470_8278 [Kitasatospora purpeofusca]